MLISLLLLGCGAPAEPSWTEQLSASGPCWEVQLGDGLSEEGTEELHSLFACINQNDNFTPFAGVVDAMDATGRGGALLGVELARLVNGLPELDIDVFGLAGFALDLLQQEPELIPQVLAVLVEALYGEPYADLTGQPPPTGASALDAGLVRPALPLLSQVAGVLLDEGPALTDELAAALTSETLDDGVCLLVGLNTSDDPAVAALSDDLLPDLGQAIALSRSPDNDLWPGASGDSLRDLTDALLLSESGDGLSPLEALRPDLGAILSDTALRDRLISALDDAESGGHLDPLPVQLLYLASVDVDGGSLSPGEDSALLSLLRMLHSADQPLSCSVRVLGFSLVDVNIDNLSVELLGFLAEQSPETIADALNLLGGALGWGLTQSVMDAVVDSGVCPLLDDQLINDLESMNRLSDPEAADLLVVMLELLGAFSPDDRIDPLVGILSTAYARGTVEPVEEALRDLASSALLDDVTDLLPVLLASEDLPTAACPTGSSPLSFEATWSLLDESLAEGGALDRLEPLVQSLLNHSATWTVLGNLSTLLSEDQAELQGLADMMTRIIALDPELSLIKDNAALLSEPALVQPALKIAESTELATALGRAELTSEGPLPFIARLITGETLESALRTVDLMLGLLSEEDPQSR